MQFFEEHFTKHHFFHAPHLWFFALLASPIHFIEMHYKKRYKLNYENAKKLFVFDFSLLLTALVIIGATIFWFTYKPEVTDLVYISIRPSAPKIASGDYVTYTINYKNASQATLISPQLKLNFPAGFVLEKTEPQDNFKKFIFSLPDLPPQAQNSVSLSGWIYGTPNKEEYVTAGLTYSQEKRKVKEEKISLLIKTLRGSVLETKITAPRHVMSDGLTPFSLNIKNNGQRDLVKIQVNLTQKENLSITVANTNSGYLKDNTWFIENLSPGQSAQLTGELKNENLNESEKTAIAFTPTIQINNINIPQNTVEYAFQIAYPKTEIKTSWQNNQEKIRPGETASLQLEITNIGNVNLVDNQIEIPLPTTIVDITRLQKLNLGQVKNQTLIITANELVGLKLIKVNEKINHNIQIPILLFPQGNNDLTLSLGISSRGSVEEIKNSIYNADSDSPALKIGTQVSLQPEARYFTNEGDQLGRGPLPPQVGKETKYWISIPITNTTSKIKNLRLTAELPDYVQWTGKTSVNYGNNPIYDNSKRQISWTLASLPANTQAGVYFEVAFTPTAEQTGTTPLLLKNIAFSTVDSYIDTAISKTSSDIDNSLLNDAQAQSRGVKVE